jgi:hypothetical protein
VIESGRGQDGAPMPTSAAKRKRKPEPVSRDGVFTSGLAIFPDCD